MSKQEYIEAEYREIVETGKGYGEIVPQRVIIPFDHTVPDPRIPCILLVDTSGSMSGDRISQVNRMLPLVKAALAEDPLASQRVELSVVTFGDVAEVIHDFALVDRWQPMHLSAPGSSTAMGAALNKALDLLEARKLIYRNSGTDYYRPWIILLTDGGATDTEEMEQATARIRDYQRKKKVVFVPLGIGEDAKMFQTLIQISDYTLPFNERKWNELTAYLIGNFKSVSQSQPNDQVGPSDPSAFTNQHLLRFMGQ